MWPQALFSGFCVIACPPEFSRDFLQGEEHNAMNSLIMELGPLLLSTFCSNATSKLAIEEKKKKVNSLLVSLCVLRSTAGCAQRVGRGALLAAAVHALCLHVDTSMQYEALALPVSLLRDFALLAHLHLLLSC